jgi:protein TonB
MFASISETPRRPLGTGALVSLAAHAALIAVAIWVSAAKPKVEPPPKLLEMKLVTASATRTRPASAPSPASAGTPDRPRRTASTRLTPPATPKAPAVTPPPADLGVSQEGAPGDAPRGGAALGDGAPGANGAGAGGGTGNGPPPGIEVIPFGAGMVEPRLLTKTEVTYSSQAWAMRVGGVALARCIIELDGSLSSCRISRGLPYMDEAILNSLRGWRYTPVLYQGHAQRVEMVITIRVPAPPRD